LFSTLITLYNGGQSILTGISGFNSSSFFIPQATSVANIATANGYIPESFYITIRGRAILSSILGKLVRP